LLPVAKTPGPKAIRDRKAQQAPKKVHRLFKESPGRSGITLLNEWRSPEQQAQFAYLEPLIVPAL
jgi:hypothetical protein